MARQSAPSSTPTAAPVAAQRGDDTKPYITAAQRRAAMEAMMPTFHKLASTSSGWSLPDE